MATTSRGGLDRRAFIVDGTPLKHWSKDNFEPERDESCRVVYKPKDGHNFFRKSLRTEDYIVMRNSSAMEQPFFSKYNRFYPKQGHFCCKGCGNPLYSHDKKLKREDGWPAFGACVDGAVGMTTAEERWEKEEHIRTAAVRIQAFVRGCLGRAKVSQQIGKLIERVMELQQRVVTEEATQEEGTGDKDTISCKSRESKQLLEHWSLHFLDSYSYISEGDSSSSSLNSFGDDEDEQRVWTNTPEANAATASSRKAVATFAAMAALKRSQDSKAQDSLISSEFNELLVEIHCHRCKSHLGNVYEEMNRGQDGVTFYNERHRVNGRALKYIEDDLPKRTRTDSSLLFATISQARLLGLKAAEPLRKVPEFAKARNRNIVFVSPLSQKKKKVTMGARPGVGTVTFQSPERAPKKRLTPNQQKMDTFFLSRSVH